MNNLRENIITIRSGGDISRADPAFSELLQKTESYLNDCARNNPTLYKRCSPDELEKISEAALKEMSFGTPFRPEEIKLVAGARFPDIQAERFYGVEVKSTKTDTWQSTGSSIVESTRIKDVSNIYMLFGKLGGTPAEFRCRPYQDCLVEIAVTHSPRYKIDMAIADSGQPNIFEKMGIGYNSFRTLTEKDKIAKVRQYYKSIDKCKPPHALPWWLGGENSDISSPITIRYYNDLDTDTKDEIQARMFVLFPEVLQEKNPDKYKRAALWMCSRYSVINLAIRDIFSASGRIIDCGGIHFTTPMPHVLHELYRSHKRIIELLDSPDDMLLQDWADYRDRQNSSTSLMNSWFAAAQRIFDTHSVLKTLNIQDLFNQWK